LKNWNKNASTNTHLMMLSKGARPSLRTTSKVAREERSSLMILTLRTRKMISKRKKRNKKKSKHLRLTRIRDIMSTLIKCLYKNPSYLKRFQSQML
jgi:hypothetical protein